jgi:hypothetical protein
MTIRGRRLLWRTGRRRGIFRYLVLGAGCRVQGAGLRVQGDLTGFPL